MKKTKITVLAFALSICYVLSYAQSKTEVSIHSGMASNMLHRIQNVTGGASGDGRSSLLSGVRVGYGLTERLALVSGFDYARHDFTIVSAPMPMQVRTDGRITTLSLPMEVKWRIGRWFFIQGGPSIDIQPEKWESVDNQDGIGFSAGIGGRYASGDWSFSLIPSVKQYALIPFGEERYHQRLMTIGAMLAIGYRF